MIDLLDDIAIEHGLHATDQISVRVDDLTQIAGAMERLRAAPPRALGGRLVELVEDLSLGAGGLPIDVPLVTLPPSGTTCLRRSTSDLKSHLGLADAAGSPGT